MYGLLLESACWYGQVEYGEIMWEKVMARVGCKNSIFNTHKTYPDNTLSDIAEACAAVIAVGDVSDYMVFFGRCFVRYCSQYEEYEKILCSSGRHFCQFLQEVDNVHSRMRFSYHKMKSPSMLVTACQKDGAILQYRSRRKGLTHYLIGQLLQIANDFYNMALQVSVLTEETEGTIQIVNLRLEFDNTEFLREIQIARMDFKRKPLPFTTLGKLLNFFPFCLVLDESLNIKLAGERLLQLMGKEILDKPFHKNFRVRRPIIELQWQVIQIYGKVAWEVYAIIKSKDEDSKVEGNHTNDENFLTTANFQEKSGERTGRRRSHRTEWVEKNRQTPSPSYQKGLLLKGQMFILKEHKLALFLSMPLLSDADEMEEMHLFLNDLSMHDLSREMVLQGWQHGSNLEIMYDRAEANSNKLEESLSLLEQWKTRGDDLLYSMLPRPVAEHLRQGKNPITTCQSFEQVSVMFAEAIHVEEHSNLPALEVVRSVNDTFSLMDSITEKYQVFKVETVGGVYMVVGGAPEPIVDHAAQVAALALHMVDAVTSVVPCTHKIRIGIHVGPVVAGVVGNKLPHYCLFGDTVNTAARMQTHCTWGSVQVSEKCAIELQNFGFQTAYRGQIKIKGKGEMNTFWLNNKEKTVHEETESSDESVTKQM